MNIIPFESAKVPAVITQMFGNAAGDLVGTAASGGFPVVSIKGKVFHIQRGDERTLITKPGEDDPAASIEVVIVKANPNRSKVFYANGYQEGESAKPNCYSNDGIEPAADAQEPQSKKCATCAHNQWGARVTSDGRKAKACSDSRRIAIATVDTPADPMLLRVPAASMKAMEDYGKQLAARGLPPQAVVTKIGFDYSVAHPQLTFKPVGLIGEPGLLNEIKKVADSELAATIVGTKPMVPQQSEAAAPAVVDEEAAPEVEVKVAPPAAPKPVAAKPKPAPKADPVEEAVAAAATTKKATVKVETEVKPAAKAVEAAEQSIESMLGELDFDD